MKKILFLLPILVLFTFSPILKPVWAAPRVDLDARITNAAEKMTAMVTKTAERQDTALSALKTRADEMVSMRITSLNELLSRVQNDNRLSQEEKTTLTTNINTMITNLQSLKAKIDADTDITTARADAKSIVTSYHVYVTFEPQTRLLTIVNNLQTTTTTVQNLVPQLSSLSATLKSEGKDTTAMDSAIADINTQLAAIQTLLSKDATTLGSLSLTNNTYASTFVQIRQDLAKVRADFAQIRHDIATIRNTVHESVSESSLKIHTIPSVTPQPTVVK